MNHPQIPRLPNVELVMENFKEICIPPSPALIEKEEVKFCCILLIDSQSFCLEIYRFDLNDDPKHNDQHPHLCRIIPSGFVPFPTTESGIPFHSNPKTISLKPTTPTAPHGIAACGRFSTVLGFNTFLFHIAKDESTRTTEVAFIDLTTPSSNWVILPPPPMPSDPLQVHALVLCNKLYCLGSYKEEKPWIVAYDPSLNQWESLPGPSNCPIHMFFSVAIEVPSPTIIVGSTLGHLQVYDVASKTWKLQKFENTDNEFIPFPKNQPVVVGSKFYWYEHCKHRLVGYDWLTKEWYLADVHNMHDCDESLEEEDLCLGHIGGDNFCLFWKSLTGSDTFRIHCLKFQVAKYRPIVGSTYCLAASIFTPCQSYVFSGLKSFLNGLVG